MQLNYAPDQPQLFLLREKTEDPQFEPHTGTKMAQGLVSPSSISVVKQLLTIWEHFSNYDEINTEAVKLVKSPHQIIWETYHSKNIIWRKKTTTITTTTTKNNINKCVNQTQKNISQSFRPIRRPFLNFFSWAAEVSNISQSQPPWFWMNKIQDRAILFCERQPVFALL